MDAANRQAASGTHSLGGSPQATFANYGRQGFDKVLLRLATGRASVMKPAETAKGHGPLRCVVYNHWMNQAGAGFVHVFEPLQSAVPFADEDAFIALVAVYGDYSQKDVAASDIPFDYWPPRVAWLQL